MFSFFARMQYPQFAQAKALLATIWRRSKEVTSNLWDVFLFELAFLSKFLQAFMRELHPDLASPPSMESTLERVSSTETIVEKSESCCSTSETSDSPLSPETESPNSS